MLKTALAAICLLTLCATVYLSASLLIVPPPRANYQQWAVVAVAIVGHGSLTLLALRSGRAKALRHVVTVGGAAIASVGASLVYSTVSGPHFEGYAFLLGSMLVVQGLLTLITFAGLPASVVHSFGTDRRR